MQTNVFLKGTALTDSAGRPVMERPAITMNTKTELILTQLDSSGNTGMIASWEFTVNEKCNAQDSVKLRISQGITTDSTGAVHVDLGNTVSQELVQAMGQSPSRRMFGELAGYASGNSVPSRCMQFPLEIRNRIGGGNLNPGTVSGTMTEAQIRALIADQSFVQKQADWEQSDTAKTDYIKNKPEIPESLSDLTDDSTHRTVTDAEKTAWNGKMAEVTGGTAGQYLKKTADGQEWADVVAGVQSVNGQTGAVVLTAGSVGAMAEVTGGTAGQVLTQTANGPAWQNPTGGNVIRLAECTGLGFTTSSDGPHFSWIDPDNVVLNSSILAEWNQTDLVRKEGSSYPTDHTDGSVVATTSVALANKNYYRDHEFIDTTQVSGGTYSYKLFSKTGSGAWNNLAANEFSSGLGLSWAQVALYVKAGYGPTLWPVGTVFIVPHEEYQSTGYEGIAFRVAGHDQVPATDESLTHTMCLEMVDVLFTAPYDASELLYALTADTTAQANKTYYKYESSTYTALVEGTDYEVGDPVPAATWYEKNHIYNDGRVNENFNESNILQWLNSSGNANSWFTPKNLWDQCSSTLLSKNGFLKHLDANFLAIVKAATVITNTTWGSSTTYTTSSLFWLLSQTQVFGTGVENARLQYYVNGGSGVKKLLGTSSSKAWNLRSTDYYPGSLSLCNKFSVKSQGDRCVKRLKSVKNVISSPMPH